jgi:hypothetical protein
VGYPAQAPHVIIHMSGEGEAASVQRNGKMKRGSLGGKRLNHADHSGGKHQPSNDCHSGAMCSLAYRALRLPCSL